MHTFLKQLMLFMIPMVLFFLINIGTFYAFDPFNILYEHDEFYNSIVDYNEDYVATERYLKHKDEYDSFILGSSRAGHGFRVESWASVLGNDCSKAFSFTASNESIFGIWSKLKFLDEGNHTFNNVLIVIDSDITFKKYVNSKGHLYIKHPQVSHESKVAFVREYLKDYIFSGFSIAFLDYKIFKTKRSYMSRFLIFDDRDPKEKYLSFDAEYKEKQILMNEQEFYQQNEDIFYERGISETVSSKQISSQGIAYLNEIVYILAKNNTSYKIVISPLYDQKKINELDLKILTEIFGAKNVFDFSGKNQLTDDKHNYYEEEHYRFCVGDQILKSIYERSNLLLVKDKAGN